jgi:hypothetical protein
MGHARIIRSQRCQPCTTIYPTVKPKNLPQSFVSGPADYFKVGISSSPRAPNANALIRLDHIKKLPIPVGCPLINPLGTAPRSYTSATGVSGNFILERAISIKIDGRKGNNFLTNLAPFGTLKRE